MPGGGVGSVALRGPVSKTPPLQESQVALLMRLTLLGSPALLSRLAPLLLTLPLTLPRTRVRRTLSFGGEAGGVPMVTEGARSR